MNANTLKMSTTKTEIIMFGSKAQLSKCSTKIDSAGDKIPKHVLTKCRTFVLNYVIIKNIRIYLIKDATKILVLSLVISHLDIAMLYCLKFQKVSYELRVTEIPAYPEYVR